MKLYFMGLVAALLSHDALFAEARSSNSLFGSSSSSSSSSQEDRTCRDKEFRCPPEKKLARSPAHNFEDFIAVANRNGGTVSLVDPDSLETVVEYPLSDDGEPMYVNYDSHSYRLPVQKLCSMSYWI